MSYLVLARKFRPQTFSSVVGQEHITRALAHAIVRGRMPHALLLTGPRGVGKTSTARVVARALNCTGRELPDDPNLSGAAAVEKIEPCCQCTNCQEIAKSSSLAVWEIDGASNNSVDNVRELIESLHQAPPPGSRYKIYIIDEVHMLSTAAFNALLKSLEEPPANTIFMFATTEPHKIPETVISRCQRHDFRRLNVATIVENLRQIADAEGVSVDEAVLQVVAKKAQGGMRDAQSMFDRLLSFTDEHVDRAAAERLFGSVDPAFYVELSESIFVGDHAACFILLDRAFEQSIDMRSFLGEFVAHWRFLLLLATTESSSRQELMPLIELSGEDLDTALQLVQGKSAIDLNRLFEVAQMTADRALKSAFPRYVLEAGVAKMASLPSIRPLSELLSELERGPASGQSRGRGAAANSAPRVSAVREQTPTEEIAKSPASDEPLSFDSPAAPTSFNPSWQDFVQHVKKSSAPVLSAFLRRATPTSFLSGVLELEASAFDAEALQGVDQLQELRRCLFSYSGVEEWLIRISQRDTSEAGNAGSAGSYRGLAGSIEAHEAEQREKQSRQIRSEARNDPLVQSALSTFKGSTIDKVSVLK